MTNENERPSGAKAAASSARTTQTESVGEDFRPEQRASLVEDHQLAEVIWSAKEGTRFAVSDKVGNVTVTRLVNYNGRQVYPPRDPYGLIEKGVILLACKVSKSSEDQATLMRDMQAFIHRYCDLPSFWEQLATHFALMTWVYDRFTAVPYLRFQGEPQTGKSRSLHTVAHICYKAIVAGGSTTASPLFRLLELYGGTFLVDEADFKNSDAWVEIIKILNSGYMRGVPVLRSEKTGGSYEPRAFDVFGPKIIANRYRFADHAVETRCLTLEMPEGKIRADIPRQLPTAFFEEAQRLRNRLLRWRFDNYFRIVADEKPLLHLEPRLAQIGTPIYSVSLDDGFKRRLLEFLGKRGVADRTERPQAAVIEAIKRCAASRVDGLISVKQVADAATELSRELGEGDVFSGKQTGSLIRSLGFETERKRDGYKFILDRERLKELLRTYGGELCELGELCRGSESKAPE